MYNNDVYVYKCYRSLKMATNNSRNMQECFCIQELVQFVGDALGQHLFIIVPSQRYEFT
jgi:hypothetical protein